MTGSAQEREALVATLREAVTLLLDVPDNAETHEAALAASEALDVLASRLADAERERDEARGIPGEAQVVVPEKRWNELRSAEARLQAAEAALREIEALESDRGTYDVVWDGVRQWVPKFKVIARAYFAEQPDA